VNELLERLKKDFEGDEETRFDYSDGVANAFVSAQLRAMREDRKLSQQELADMVGTKQSGISRLEKAHYSTWKIETLRKLARAFGVRVRISFEEFGTLPDDLGGFSKERLCPRPFAKDPVFFPVEQAQTVADEAVSGEVTHQVRDAAIPNCPAGQA